MIRDKRKKKALGLIISFLVIVYITTVSYSFFKLVTDNTNPEKVALTTGTMELVFADNDNEIIGGEWDFGESVTKKFTLTNTGTIATSASLDWKNLVNTYQNRSLSYRLLVSTTEDGPTTEVVPETNMPVTASPIRQTICSEISVPVGTTYYYQLVITLNDLPDVEQSADIGAEFNTEFIVDQPRQYRYYRLTINTNGGAFSDNTIVKEHLLKHQNTVELEEPARTGYTFAGWRIQGTDSTVEGTTFTMGISDTYLYAEWTPKEYILSINRNDGSSIENRTVKLNTPTVIETPTREGYTFTGWNVTGGTFNKNEFTLTTPSNTSIEATWEINNYKYIVYHNKQNVNGEGYIIVNADTDEGEAAYNTEVTPETKTYTGFTSPEKKSLTIQAETTYPPELNKIDYNYSRNKYKLTIDPNGGTYNGKTENTVEEIYYEASIDLNTPTSAPTTLAALGKTVKAGTPNFASAAVTNETADGLYAMADDYGISYYYRGAVDDNYVKFAGFYWRIIRINGDGSLRMIYDGTSAHANSEDNTDRFTHLEKAWNSNGNDAKYLGWMYGGVNGEHSTSREHAQTNETNSDLKNLVNSWYDEYLIDYDKYIEDVVYCNDRSTPGSSVTGWADDTGLGFGTNPTAYGDSYRASVWRHLGEEVLPQFTCPSKNDSFTVSDNIYGNAIGTEKSRKIGLITADETVAAGSGGYSSGNQYYYLHKSPEKYWTMSPSDMYTDGISSVFVIDINYNQLGTHHTNLTNSSVAPVISLSSDYAKKLTGSGTMDEPFRLLLLFPEKTGYTFTGWTIAGGNGALEGSTYTMGDGETTVTANYEPKQYSVTFNANGGIVDTGSKTVTYNSIYGDLPEPTYTGHRFMGWFTAQTGGIQVTKNTSVAITENQTLYAHWASNTLQAVGSYDFKEKIWSQKANIKKVVFENVMNAPASPAYTYDVSSTDNNSVIAYLVADETDSSKYIAHIQADGKIYANQDSSYLFYAFNSLESVEGIEYLDTSNVTDMAYMFYGCNRLTTLDLSNFNTSNVTDMSWMFSNCSKLTTLDLSSFNTSNVTDMSQMFYYCNVLTTTITIRGTKCTNYNLMFADAATTSGAKITVNYTSDASTRVDNMIATKRNSTSNVVKGSVVS